MSVDGPLVPYGHPSAYSASVTWKEAWNSFWSPCQSNWMMLWAKVVAEAQSALAMIRDFSSVFMVPFCRNRDHSTIRTIADAGLSR